MSNHMNQRTSRSHAQYVLTTAWPIFVLTIPCKYSNVQLKHSLDALYDFSNLAIVLCTCDLHNVAMMLCTDKAGMQGCADTRGEVQS